MLGGLVSAPGAGGGRLMLGIADGDLKVERGVPVGVPHAELLDVDRSTP